MVKTKFNPNANGCNVVSNPSASLQIAVFQSQGRGTRKVCTAVFISMEKIFYHRLNVDGNRDPEDFSA